MARPLTVALDAAMLDPVRLPAYQVEIYDVRSTAADLEPTRIGHVVRALVSGFVLPEVVGPRIFTDAVVSAELTETAGDYAQNGVASAQLSLSILDAVGTLDPVENGPTATEPLREGRWLRQGNVVVVREGDVRVPVAEWAITFTGRLRGQVGCDRNRTTGAALLSARAGSREVDFLRLLRTSQDFPQATPFSTIASALAEQDLGLDLDEIALPAFTARSTAFTSTQFVDASPLVSLAQLMFPDGFMPRFNGKGQLSGSSSSLDKGPTRVYADAAPVLSIVRPLIDQNGPNEVEIVGLSSEKSRVEQERQTLANASITTGFFTRKATIPVRWSDDGTQQALSVRFEVDSSVADGIFNFGGERYKPGPATADGATVNGEIEVDGGLEASLIFAYVLAGVWMFSHQVSDGVITFGVGATTGITKPIGRLFESTAGQTLFTVLAKQGRGQYRITGRPFEYVFREIIGLARVTGLLDEERNAIRIENHLLASQVDVDAVALRTLKRLRFQQNARTIVALHDVALEPDDVIVIGEGDAARRYMIQSIRRRLERGGRGDATYSAFEITQGVRP